MVTTTLLRSVYPTTETVLSVPPLNDGEKVMPTHVLLITLLTVAAFVGMALYLVLRRHAVRYPEGHRIAYSFARKTQYLGLLPPALRNTTVVVIAPTKYRAENLLEPSLIATIAYGHVLFWYITSTGLLAADKAWLTSKKVVINYTHDVPHGLKGVMTSVSSAIGKTRYPMLTVDIWDVEQSLLQGTPWPDLLGHEFGHLYACHVLGHPDSAHKDPTVFLDTPYEGEGDRPYTFEERFRNEYGAISNARRKGWI